MVIFAICTLFYILVILFDLVPIFRTRKYRICLIYSIMILSAYISRVLIFIDIKVPSPNEAITNLYKPLMNAISQVIFFQ